MVVEEIIGDGDDDDDDDDDNNDDNRSYTSKNVDNYVIKACGVSKSVK